MRRSCFLIAAIAILAFSSMATASPIVRGRGLLANLALNQGLAYASAAFGAGCGAVPAQAAYLGGAAMCAPQAAQFAPQMAYGVQQQFAPQFAQAGYGVGAAFAPGVGFAPQFAVGSGVIVRQRGIVVRNRGIVLRGRALAPRRVVRRR